MTKKGYIYFSGCYMLVEWDRRRESGGKRGHKVYWRREKRGWEAGKIGQNNAISPNISQSKKIAEAGVKLK